MPKHAAPRQIARVCVRPCLTRLSIHRIAPAAKWGVRVNKYLMMSAAALLANVGGAAAANKTVDTIYIGGNPAIQLSHDDEFYNAGYLSGVGGGIGFGIAERTRSIGKHVDLSDNYYGNYRSIAINFDLQLPLKNGHRWTTWIEFSGTTSFVANSGTHTVNGPGANRTASNIVGETKALIAKLRASRQANAGGH